jgi:tetratricopeptide (TPR) repeat protein
MARLDRLGSAKEVAQVAAIIGREFSYEMLHAVHPSGEDELGSALATLAGAELLYARGIPPDATYTFKHALIRDAAYGALLKTRRRELHRKIALTMGERFPALAEAQPEVLAQHWTEAGEVEPALAAWSKAGQSAETGNAFREALESYQRSVALLDQLPKTPERDLRELELRQSIVRMLQMTKGLSAPETIEATERMAALAERSGHLSQLLNLIILRNTALIASGDLAGASAVAEQSIELALREGSSANLAAVRTGNLLTCYLRGDLDASEQHFTLGLSFFDDPAFRQFPGVAVSAFGFSSWNTWTLGRADLAHHRQLQIMEIVKRENPFDLAFSDRFIAGLSIFMRQYKEAETAAGRALELSEKYRFANRAAWSWCFLGFARSAVWQCN